MKRNIVTVLLILVAVFMFKHFQTSVISRHLNPIGGALLTPLLIPRVPGTYGSQMAREHIIKHLKMYGWDVKLHKFNAETPKGRIEMTNILASAANHAKSGKQGKPGKARLTLAAHYDSKIEPEGFIGAIDSAFPCALLLHLASIKRHPKRRFDLVFFDGEEAFENWSKEDSLYGSRALAAYQQERDELPNTLVLLDLLGYKQREPIPSWYKNTRYLYNELAEINKKLLSNARTHMRTHMGTHTGSDSVGDLVGGVDMSHLAHLVEDDHVPYVERQVRVLHLMPARFPDFWHTLDDNALNLDWETMEMWAEIMQLFLFSHE